METDYADVMHGDEVILRGVALSDLNALFAAGLLERDGEGFRVTEAGLALLDCRTLPPKVTS